MFEVFCSQASGLNYFFLLGEGNGTPLQYSCLENPMDGGAWRAAVHGVTKSWTRLSDFTHKVRPVICVSFVQGEICAELCLFVFPLMGKAEWGDSPVCWQLGLYFCFVCCLDEASCTGCYCCLGDAGSYIQVVSFVWVLTIWYSLGKFSGSLGSWSQYSHSKGSGLDLWSGMKIVQMVCYGIKWY